MWPFNRKTYVREATAKDLMDAVTRHERLIGQLREDHETLAHQHRQLRGRVYGAGVHKTGVPVDGEGSTMSNPQNAAPAVLDKQELRKRMGFIPGRPMVHKE